MRATDRAPDSPTDRRRHTRLPGRIAPPLAGSSRPGEEGRTHGRLRRGAQGGIRTCSHQRRSSRPRRSHRARQEEAARHRCGGGPARGPRTGHRRDRNESHRRLGRASAQGWPGSDASCAQLGRRAGAHLLRTLFLPLRRLFNRGNRTADVLLQQPAWRLSEVHRSRRRNADRPEPDHPRPDQIASGGRSRTLVEVAERRWLVHAPARSRRRGPGLHHRHAQSPNSATSRCKRSSMAPATGSSG